MAVAVALGKTFFDTTALKNEHKRLSQELLHANPRDAMDPSQDLTFSCTINGVLRKFVVYMKGYQDKATDAPSYRFFFKDDNNQEQFFPAGITALPGPPANVQMVAIDGTVRNVVAGNSLVVDMGSGAIRFNNNAGDDNHLGQVKFSAATGLEVAQINTRIAELNNALDGLTKVLTVLQSNVDAGISLIR